VVGMIFSSKLTLIRNSWHKKTSDAKANVIAQRKKLAESEKAVVLAKAELQRAIHGWERYWPAVQVDRGQQPGVLGLTFGTNQGLALNAPVYVFQPAENGNGVSYVGPFKVKEVNEAQAALTPLWRLRMGEEATWRYGPNWRIRTNIPRQYQNTLSDLELMLLRKDEILIAQQKHLQIQQEAKKSAEEHVHLRMKELNGDPNLGPKEKSLNRFLVEGLHKAVADTEKERDAVQADVDELRRLVKRTRDEIERLTADNERLAKRLSGPAQTASTIP
jgi:hypothetical protein